MNENMKIALAEVIGTAILVIGGCGTAVLAAGAMPGTAWTGIGAFGVATAFGISLLVLAYAIGHISGCHVNPAVTFGMFLAGKLPASKLPTYWIAQIIGGLIGGGLLRLIFSASSKVTVPGQFASDGWGKGSPAGFGLGSVAIVEILMTAIFVFAVISTTHPKFPAGFGGLAAGGALWLVHLISIPVSNTSVNPARSLAVAPFAPNSLPIKQVWAFLVFPLVGAALAALAYRFLNSEDAPLSASAPSGSGAPATQPTASA
jgi:aquaporin Z